MNVSAWKSDEEQRRPLLKTSPLRLPGQSNQERIEELADGFMPEVVATLFLVLLAFIQWIEWWFELPHKPIPATVMALAAIAYVWKKGVPVRLMIKNLKLGRDGERVVGESLEPLRAKGYRVFHDITSNGFNIDHVIVGPAGVFTIETKTRSKPSRGCSSIVYDGETVRIGNGAPTNEPLIQARAQARWLADLLNDGRSRTLVVRPIVVFPEWFVEPTNLQRKPDVWVVNVKLLANCLSNEPSVLSSELIDSVANTLTRHSRQLAA